MPLRQFLQLAETHLERARQDKEALTNAKLDFAKVDAATILIGALLHLMATWTDVQFDKPETQKIWKEKQAEAENLGFELSEEQKRSIHHRVLRVRNDSYEEMSPTSNVGGYLGYEKKKLQISSY
jgi:hypothetical protein